jgi:hypothetical protein
METARSLYEWMLKTSTKANRSVTHVTTTLTIWHTFAPTEQQTFLEAWFETKLSERFVLKHLPLSLKSIPPRGIPFAKFQFVLLKS